MHLHEDVTITAKRRCSPENAKLLQDCSTDWRSNASAQNEHSIPYTAEQTNLCFAVSLVGHQLSYTKSKYPKV